MAKECSICGKKLGFLSGKVAVSDGIVCDSCWLAAVLELSFNSLMTSITRTVNLLLDMIVIEVLKRAAELTGRTDLAAAAPQAVRPRRFCWLSRKNMRRLAGIIRWNPMTACLQASGRR